MSVKEYMKATLDDAVENSSNEQDVCVYVAKYDGKYKVIFAD